MNWFEEQLEVGKGRAVKVAYTRHLHSQKSPFQQIDIYDTPAFGRMLVHDQVIMATESDEAHYHEMIAHVPLCVHPRPARVLVIGGGDGGTVREVLKHDRVESLHLCEIDQMVVDVCRAHFPEMSSGFDDPRVECFFEDGAAFVEARKSAYDVIIVDSSDPIGPAEVLFQERFYRHLHAALSEDGILVSQSESFHYHLDTIGQLIGFAARIFPIYQYYYTLMPTYPSGAIGFSYCAKRWDALRDLYPQRIGSIGAMRYYNEAIHRAAFVLPEAVATFLNRSLAMARS